MHCEDSQIDLSFYILQAMLPCSHSSQEFFEQLLWVLLIWPFSWNRLQISRFTWDLISHSTWGRYGRFEAIALQNSWTKGSCKGQPLLSAVYCRESGCRIDFAWVLSIPLPNLLYRIWYGKFAFVALEYLVDAIQAVSLLSLWKLQNSMSDK